MVVGSILADISVALGALETLCVPFECLRTPHGGIQVALRVLLARHYPIQVEIIDSPSSPKGAHGVPKGAQAQFLNAVRGA